MRLFVPLLLLTATLAPAAPPPANVLPNGSFQGADPFKGWLTGFPDESWYKENAQCVKPAPDKSDKDHRAIVFDMPTGLAGNQGCKIESEPVKVVPGATYKVEIDCMTWDFSAKLHAEAWTTDPHPEQKRTLFRRAPRGELPPLMMCFRAQLPDPPAGGKTWSTVSREFKVPEKVVVAGKTQSPEFITVKAVAYAATTEAGKSYFANFRLSMVPGKAEDEKVAAPEKGKP